MMFAFAASVLITVIRGVEKAGINEDGRISVVLQRPPENMIVW
jgi:hypothetical protein